MRKAKLVAAVMGGNPYPITYLFQDEFTTAEAAPITAPRAAEPGPGSWTVTDVAGKFSISSNALQVAIGSAAIENLASVETFTRAAGLALQVTITWGAGALTPQSYIGWYKASPTTLAGRELNFARFTASMLAAIAAQTPDVSGDPSGETAYSIVLRAAGGFFVVGSQLVYVSTTPSTATLYAGLLTRASTNAYAVNSVRIAQLGGPWNGAYGPGILAVSGAISAGQVFTHQPNFLAYFTITNIGTAGNTVIVFRVQDANNYWKLTIASDGSADLSEVVATVATSRGTAVAGIFANGERCGISCNGTLIFVFDSLVDRITYASATNFQAATAGELDALATDAVYSNLEVYPMDLTGAALGWLQAITP